MTREDKRIKEMSLAAEDFISFDLCEIPFSEEEQQFVEYCFGNGAQWADNHPKSPWINVKENLPCSHKDLLINNGLITKKVLVVEDNSVAFDRMAFRDSGWEWVTSICPSHWALVPELPKE